MRIVREYFRIRREVNLRSPSPPLPHTNVPLRAGRLPSLFFSVSNGNTDADGEEWVGS